MPKTLFYLIKASGVASPTTGDSFDTDVPDSVAGAKITEYVLNVTNTLWTGTPTTPLPVYADNTLFNIEATFSRGSRFFNIQRNTSNAWAVSVSGSGGPSGESGTLETFASTGSPNGATHQLGVRVRGRFSGSSVSVAAVQRLQDEPPNPFTDPWPVYFQQNTGTPTPTGTTTLTLDLQYSPDTGMYNDFLADSWSFIMDNRPTLYDTEWHTNATYTNLVATANNFLLSNSGLYPSDPAGLKPGESITLYLRYKTAGTATWTNYGAVTCTDTR